MRVLSVILAASIATSTSAAETGGAPHLHNSAMAFATFWDAYKDKPEAEQLAGFRQQVAPGFPSFYSIDRFEGRRTQEQQDKLIMGAIKEFGQLREPYIRKAQQFEAELPRYVATFKAQFPDYLPPDDIYVLHSLGEMDGGTRTIDGKNQLIFGVNGMIKYHGSGNESAFFHHELFHIYHEAAIADCTGRAVWSALWREGLATYVSKVMNPQASEQELLLEVPQHMAQRTRAVLPEALAQLETVLGKDDYDSYAALFYTKGDGGALPPRRGYYLGYLVAQEAGKTRSIQELAKLDCGQVKTLVFSTVHKLRAAAPASAIKN